MKTNHEKLIEFGKTIKKYRENKKLSLKEMSIKSGINIKYLKKIENGTAVRLNIDHLYSISVGFDIPITSILDIYSGIAL